MLQSPDTWPEWPSVEPPEDKTELRKSAFCGVTVTSYVTTALNDKVYSTWQELMDVTARELQQNPCNSLPTAEEYHQAKVIILQRVYIS